MMTMNNEPTKQPLNLIPSHHLAAMWHCAGAQQQVGSLIPTYRYMYFHSVP